MGGKRGKGRCPASKFQVRGRESYVVGGTCTKKVKPAVKNRTGARPLAGFSQTHALRRRGENNQRVPAEEGEAKKDGSCGKVDHRSYYGERQGLVWEGERKLPATQTKSVVVGFLGCFFGE